MPNEQTPSTLQDNDETGILDLLNSPIDPYSFTMDKLRKVLSFAIRTSMGGGRYWSKKIRPRWWDKSIGFHNIKAGYSKDELVRLIKGYRHQQVPSSVMPDSHQLGNGLALQYCLHHLNLLNALRQQGIHHLH